MTELEEKIALREDLYKWFSEHVSSSNLFELYLGLNKVEQFAKKKKLISGSLLDPETLDKIKLIKTYVSTNAKFIDVDNKQIPIIKDALQLLSEYWSKHKKVVSSDIINAYIPETNTDEDISDMCSDSLVGYDTLSSEKEHFIDNTKFSIPLNLSHTDDFDCFDVSIGLNFPLPISNEFVQPIEIDQFDFSINHIPDIYDNNTSRSTEQTLFSYAENDYYTPYKVILAGRFRRGFLLNSAIEIDRYRTSYKKIYQKISKEKDREIQNAMKKIGIEYQGRIYSSDTMLSVEIRKKLMKYINDSFDSGKNAIYYKALFDEFSEDFLNEYIYSPEMLKSYLEYWNQGQYAIKRLYVSKDGTTEVNPVEEIRVYMKEANSILTFDNLEIRLTHIPLNKIKNVLSSNDEFIRNGVGEYFVADIVDLNNDELDDIARIIKQVIDDKEFIAGNELIEAIGRKYPQISEKLSIFSTFGKRDVIGYYLKDKFSFNGNIISKYGEELSMADVFGHYCLKHNHVTLDELNLLSKELDANIYFEAVYANSLRINQNEFISKKFVKFDIKRTDEAIDKFCISDYIAIQNVNQFASFPPIGYPWNNYLLEHYVYEYSKKYQLFPATFNTNSSVGAIIKKSSKYKNFEEILTDVLAKSKINLSADIAVAYLYEQGFIGRRSYAKIGQILTNAKRLREQEN
ncbi:MAG: hypothetical protein LBT51_10230 [Fusobacteriaceae bacterium]|jgi:hypothetical protein|nr:hypothetical protein [Fusobacteriaceae bacterium]